MSNVEGYQMCLSDFNEELKHITRKWNGVKTSYDAWRAFNDIVYWTHSKRLDINTTEKLQPVGGM